MAEGKKRVYRKNTVKGTRKGKKWPEEVRTAAMCDLMVGNNICAVARKHGVPESTLRCWMKEAEKMEPGEKKSLFVQERERQIRALGHLAARGARASVSYICSRLEENDRDAAIYHGLKRRLDHDEGIKTEEELEQERRVRDMVVHGAPGTVDEPLTQEQREQIAAQMARHRPMSDFAAANYLRALTSVAARAAEMTGDADTEDKTLVLDVEDDREDEAGAAEDAAKIL